MTSSGDQIPNPYLAEAFEEIPDRWFDKAPGILLGLGAVGMSDVLVSLQEKLLPIGSTAELMSGLAVAAVGVSADFLSTHYAFKVSDSAKAAGIGTTIQERNPIINSAETKTDLYAGRAAKLHIAVQTGVVASSLFSPYIGFGIGGGRSMFAFLNLRKTRAIRRAVELCAEDHVVDVDDIEKLLPKRYTKEELQELLHARKDNHNASQ